LTILDIDGEVVSTLNGPTGAGLQRVLWSMTRGGGGGPKKGGKGGGGGPKGQPGILTSVPPGMYRVVLNVDGQEFFSAVRVEADPNVPGPPAGAEDEEMLDPRKIN